MTMGQFEIISFLIVEDDVGRLMSLAEAFTESRIYNKLIGLPTGKAAIEYLQTNTQYAGQTAADALIFNDTMTDMSWEELVRIIREDTRFEHLRLILLSDQTLKDIISTDTGKQVELVLPRNIDTNALLGSLHRIPGFWCSFVKPQPTQPSRPPSRTFTAPAVTL